MTVCTPKAAGWGPCTAPPQSVTFPLGLVVWQRFDIVCVGPHWQLLGCSHPALVSKNSSSAGGWAGVILAGLHMRTSLGVGWGGCSLPQQALASLPACALCGPESNVLGAASKRRSRSIEYGLEPRSWRRVALVVNWACSSLCTCLVVACCTRQQQAVMHHLVSLVCAVVSVQG